AAGRHHGGDRRGGGEAGPRAHHARGPRGRGIDPEWRDAMKKPSVKRAALAYSGGLDTSIIVPWLKEHYGCEVGCYCSDVGQGAELDGLEARAKASGADRVVVEDLRETFVKDFCFPALRAGAIYEDRYLLGTSLARPLIASRQVAAALAHGCDALA